MDWQSEDPNSTKRFIVLGIYGHSSNGIVSTTQIDTDQNGFVYESLKDSALLNLHKLYT